MIFRNMSARARYLGAVVAVLAVGACSSVNTYTGGIDDPIVRKLTWFSFVGGEDIARSCRTVGNDRYRLIYNGIYQEQVRAYDVLTTSPQVITRVWGTKSLLDINTPQGLNLLEPGKPVKDTRLLGDSLIPQLAEALAQDGVFDAPLVGTRSKGDRFHWTVAACREGQFHFAVFPWPSDRLEEARFPAVIASWDKTGVPFNPPRQVNDLQLYGTNSPESPQDFVIEVGRDGMVGFDGS